MNLIPHVDIAWRASQQPKRDFASFPEGGRRFGSRRPRAGGGEAEGRDAGMPEPGTRTEAADPCLGHIVNVFAR